ncbi:protein TBATA [Dromiciops gliroides]|uniref:protein TBATA n=1 Tax=Dromiciops gliroides TaxID=33562 RepID=UPI001CC59A28|nr:protein TBATA [Dromiciops gliroides]
MATEAKQDMSDHSPMDPPLFTSSAIEKAKWYRGKTFAFGTDNLGLNPASDTCMVLAIGGRSVSHEYSNDYAPPASQGCCREAAERDGLGTSVGVVEGGFPAGDEDAGSLPGSVSRVAPQKNHGVGTSRSLGSPAELTLYSGLTAAKTSTLRKDLVRKSRSQSTSRLKETTLTPKRAEISLQEVPKVSRSWSQSTPRFGQLSHNSFFSRHNPHPNRVSHIQDLSGNPICTVRDNITHLPLPPPGSSPNFSINMLGVPRVQMPIGDPQSLVEPRLNLSSLSSVWREELKELASKVAAFSKEAEVKKKKEETERLTQYSPETGRLIPGYTRSMTSRAPRTSQRGNLWSKDMTPIVQDQELLILELLCQILQTDSLSTIQYWLVSASPREKDLVLGLLQTAVAELIPEPLISLPEERIVTNLPASSNSPGFLSQSLVPQKSLTQSHSQNGPKTKADSASSCEKPECIGNAEVLQLCDSVEDRKRKM